MLRKDIHESYDFFEYTIANGTVPAPSVGVVDIALLDMHHGWPNVGHDSLVHAIMDVAEEARETLRSADAKIRVISFDVRGKNLVPECDGRFALYVGTGGPGHLDPRQNDGISQFSQGIRENDAAWEAPLFRLFDAILARPDAALVSVCHSFGLMCRWSGVADPVLRQEKSSGVPLNTLSETAAHHPWFSQFARKLPDQRHFRVVDNRLFDLIANDTCSDEVCLSFETENRGALTMLELARDSASGMPRILGVNHHPEIIDREHVLAVLDEKQHHHTVTDAWYEERVRMMRDLFQGETERQSRLTSEYTLLGPIRHHVQRAVAERLQPVA